MKNFEYGHSTDINHKSFWGIWNRLSFGNYSKDTCSLWRNFIFSIITLPLWIFPGIIVNAIAMWKKSYTDITYWGWSIINIVILFFGYVTIERLGGHFHLYKIYLCGIVTILIIIIFCFLIFGAVWCVEYFKNKKQNRFSVIKTFFRDMKKKHCSLINWID
jgi:hypothetical protein